MVKGKIHSANIFRGFLFKVLYFQSDVLFKKKTQSLYCHLVPMIVNNRLSTHSENNNTPFNFLLCDSV